MVVTIYRPWEKHYSSIGWRVRLALEEKNLKYETRLVVLKMNEHLSEEILRLNPRGELPILTDVDITLHEEAAMVQYVEACYPTPSLQPNFDKNRKEFTETLVVFHEAVGVFAQVCRPVLVHLLNSTTEGGDATVDKELVKKWKQDIQLELQRWEKLLVHNQNFLMGKDISIADVAFFPYLAHLVRFGFSLKKSFPKLLTYYTLMSERPTVTRTWPSGWKTQKAYPYLK